MNTDEIIYRLEREHEAARIKTKISWIDEEQAKRAQVIDACLRALKEVQEAQK